MTVKEKLIFVLAALIPLMALTGAMLLELTTGQLKVMLACATILWWIFMLGALALIHIGRKRTNTNAEQLRSTMAKLTWAHHGLLHVLTKLEGQVDVYGEIEGERRHLLKDSVLNHWSDVNHGEIMRITQRRILTDFFRGLCTKREVLNIEHNGVPIVKDGKFIIPLT